jgi:hypothetical protein
MVQAIPIPPRWLERVGGFQLPDPVTANNTAGVGFIVQSERHCQACLINLGRRDHGVMRHSTFDVPKVSFWFAVRSELNLSSKPA